MPRVYNLLHNIVTVPANLVAAIQSLMAKPPKQIVYIYNQTIVNVRMSEDFKLICWSTTEEQFHMSKVNNIFPEHRVEGNFNKLAK